MDYLAYSPHIEAYACVIGQNQSRTYYDLTDDITSCTVMRNLSAPSTFTLTLANPKRKYNGVFTPMDLITILLGKDSTAQKVFSGYMTSVSAFTLYEQDFTISGKDVLYRLKELYWDPNITGSYELLTDENSTLSGWSGYNGELLKLLEDVGGWSASSVHIGALPPEVMTWAKKLYMSQASDYADAEKIASAIYTVLQSSTESISSGSSSTSSDGTLTSKQQAIVDACNSTPTTGEGWCAAWVTDVFTNAEGTTGVTPPSGNADDMDDEYCSSTDESAIKAGMIIAVHPSGATGNTYGHVGIYVGGGNVMHNADIVRTTALDTWINTYGPNGTYHGGTAKWGWVHGTDLST